MSVFSRFKKTTSYSLKTGGAIGTITGVFSDFLLPVANYGLLLSAFFAVLLVLLILLYVFFNDKITSMLNSSKNEGEGNDNSIWFAPLAFAVFFMSAITLGAYQLGSQEENKEAGFIASHLPIVKELQIQTGVLERIESNTREMVEQQKESNTHLTKVSDNTKELVEIQQKSQSALNNLANESKRQSFSAYDYGQAVAQGNLERVKFYLDSPKWRDSIHQQASYSNLIPPIETKLIEANNDVQAVKVLALLIERGLADPSKRFNTPMSGDLLEVVDKHVNQPIQAEYQAKKLVHDQKVEKETLERSALQAKYDKAQADQTLCNLELIDYHNKLQEIEESLQAPLDKINERKKAEHDRLASTRGPRTFFPETLYSNEEIKVLRAERMVDKPSCTLSSNSTENQRLMRELLSKIQVKNKLIGELNMQAPRMPMAKFAVKIEQSLLSVAILSNNDQFVSFLESKPRPADGFSRIFYSSTGDVIYSEK